MYETYALTEKDIIELINEIISTNRFPKKEIRKKLLIIGWTIEDVIKKQKEENDYNFCIFSKEFPEEADEIMKKMYEFEVSEHLVTNIGDELSQELDELIYDIKEEYNLQKFRDKYEREFDNYVNSFSSPRELAEHLDKLNFLKFMKTWLQEHDCDCLAFADKIPSLEELYTKYFRMGKPNLKTSEEIEKFIRKTK